MVALVSLLPRSFVQRFNGRVECHVLNVVLSDTTRRQSAAEFALIEVEPVWAISQPRAVPIETTSPRAIDRALRNSAHADINARRFSSALPRR